MVCKPRSGSCGVDLKPTSCVGPAEIPGFDRAGSSCAACRPGSVSFCWEHGHFSVPDLAVGGSKPSAGVGHEWFLSALGIVPVQELCLPRVTSGTGEQACIQMQAEGSPCRWGCKCPRAEGGSLARCRQVAPGAPCSRVAWRGWGERLDAEALPYRINLYCLAGVGTRVNAGVDGDEGVSGTEHNVPRAGEEHGGCLDPGPGPGPSRPPCSPPAPQHVGAAGPCRGSALGT